MAMFPRADVMIPPRLRGERRGALFRARRNFLRSGQGFAAYPPLFAVELTNL
jgi:hypothetical protein